jgi:hypothetical protein
VRALKPAKQHSVRTLGAFIALVVFSLGGERAQAMELFPFTGFVEVTPVSGCCGRLAPSQGYGLIVRMPKANKHLGDLEVSAYSDFRYTDATATKYFYLLGSDPKVDPISNSELTVTRYSVWNISLAYGMGMFTHNTYTNDYHLPILVTGIEGISRLVTSYTLSDMWSVFILLSISVGYSPAELDANLGYAVGASFRF